MPIFDILLKALPCSFSQLLHHRLITETVSLHKWQRSLIRHDYLAYKMYTLKKKTTHALHTINLTPDFTKRYSLAIKTILK